MKAKILLSKNNWRFLIGTLAEREFSCDNNGGAPFVGQKLPEWLENAEGVLYLEIDEELKRFFVFQRYVNVEDKTICRNLVEDTET